MNQNEISTLPSRKLPSLSEMNARLKQLRLPAMRESALNLAQQASNESWTHLEYLNQLTIRECEVRTENRLARHLRSTRDRHCKTWNQINWSRIPVSVRQCMEQLHTGEFLKRTSNVLIFGCPGSGKTMLLRALGCELIRAGHSVCFTPCSTLVQHLLLAKKELRLPQLLSKIGRVSALIIDDLGYVQQSREEMEVLFTLIADRYERSSILLSSNQPFSKWESIFKDPMTTAAAIDRLVHHSVILELNVPSYRLEESKRNHSNQPLAPSQSSPT